LHAHDLHAAVRRAVKDCDLGRQTGIKQSEYERYGNSHALFARTQTGNNNNSAMTSDGLRQITRALKFFDVPREEIRKVGS
jgi:hypothetical protein